MNVAKANHSQSFFIPDIIEIYSLLTIGENPDDLERVFESFVTEDDDACPEKEFEVLEASEKKIPYLEKTRTYKLLTTYS